MIHTQKRRRFFATGHRLPSGIFVRPEPFGSKGYKAKIGQTEVRGLDTKQFWENVGKCFRNRAIWASRNNRPLALYAEFMADAHDVEAFAMTFEKPKKKEGLP